MIPGTKAISLDNSGAKIVRVLRTKFKSKPAKLGEIVLVSVVSREFHKRKIRFGQVFRALVLSTGKTVVRSSGYSVSGFGNFVILIKRSDIIPISKRIYGPVPLELRQLKLSKILSMGLYVY